MIHDKPVAGFPRVFDWTSSLKAYARVLVVVLAKPEQIRTKAEPQEFFLLKKLVDISKS
jgi:hypothetical protein